MKALILWADARSGNLGVQALGQGTSDLLERAFPGILVSFQSYGPGDAPHSFDSRLLLGFRPRLFKELIDWIAEFDVVVDTGAGDSFADIYGLRRLVEMSSVREAVRRSGAPLVMGPQTYGPFRTRAGRTIARTSLRSASLAFGRDPESIRYAGAELGRRITPATDVAFAIEKSVADPSRSILVNVSGLLWDPNPHVDNTYYRESLLQLTNGLHAKGYPVSLLAHVTDASNPDNDIYAIEQFSKLLAEDPEILVPSDLQDVRQMIASAKLVIGSRMHACLNALSQGVPAIAWAYSRKFGPLLSGLNWEGVLDLRSSSPTISRTTIELAEDLIDNGAPRVAQVLEQAQSLNATSVAMIRSAVK